jgi:hypothetical protein
VVFLVGIFAATPLGAKLIEILNSNRIGALINVMLGFVIIIVSAMQLAGGAYNPFIYFRF